MKMESIGISEVLDKISTTVEADSSVVTSYHIHFLTRKGTTPVLNVKKYTRGPRQSVSGSDSRSKQAHNLQEKGTVKLHDLTNDRVIDVKAATIFAFKDFKSDTWLKVFH